MDRVTDCSLFNQRMDSGVCVRNAPLTYLENVDSVCSVELSAGLCTGGSVFDAAIYLTDANPDVAFTQLQTSAINVSVTGLNLAYTRLSCSIYKPKRLVANNGGEKRVFLERLTIELT